MGTKQGTSSSRSRLAEQEKLSGDALYVDRTKMLCLILQIFLIAPSPTGSS